MNQKKILLSLALLPLVTLLNFTTPEKAGVDTTENSSKALSGKITMSGAYALYPMAVKWGEEFKKLNPGVTFDIQGGGAGKGMTDVLSGTVNFGMVSRDISPEEVKKGAYGIAVCKDAVIPVINPNNPYLDLIKQKGITRNQFYKIFITGEITTWGEVLGNKSMKPIKIFTRSDAAGAAESWAKFLGNAYKQEDLMGTGVFGDPGLAQAVAKDPLGMGFNNINFVYDNKSRKPQPGLFPCPIDLNNNRVFDAAENVYGSLDIIDDAILSGAYPSPPARALYLVTKGKPTNPLMVAFLQWVLADGQRYLDEAGFVKLPADLLKKEASSLTTTN
ncbi:MAG: substrate-binding domain-containing protein [Chitinophagaceae bacterium]|nr:substrate-binding domain-containing protein [Chitinophagaceae bacterium]